MSDDRDDDLFADEEIPEKIVPMRKLTNADIDKYEAMIESWIRGNGKNQPGIIKNWNEADTRPGQDNIALGNSGYTMADIRQHLRTEVCVALLNYDPNYVTPEGRTVLESTFVYNHLRFRVGQLMKRLTRKGMGYGVWVANLEEVLWETDKD
jgi:hypothetical protein